ncbi:hypothetical protein O3G_MSEX007603 [Manduca sexta]|uniref:Uncharacterized protein n=1 Tax=Manduca sexta TaxID=7130 RepID=A0A921Z7G0_MANSE|nr:hypothetical protein O3G_MSEX007603 [Manduca sexta]
MPSNQRLRYAADRKFDTELCFELVKQGANKYKLRSAQAPSSLYWEENTSDDSLQRCTER